MNAPLCLWCEEPVLEGEASETAFHSLSPLSGQLREVHLACSARSVLGGLNHQKGLCTCCGGTEPPDPPELSRREAAFAAWAYARHLRSMDPPE